MDNKIISPIRLFVILFGFILMLVSFIGIFGVFSKEVGPILLSILGFSVGVILMCSPAISDMTDK